MLKKSTRGRRSDLFLSDFIKLLLLFLNSVGDIYRPAIAFSVSLKIVPRHSIALQWEGLSIVIISLLLLMLRFNKYKLLEARVAMNMIN